MKMKRLNKKNTSNAITLLVFFMELEVLSGEIP